MIEPELKKISLLSGESLYIWILSNYTDFETGSQSHVGKLIKAAKYGGNLDAVGKLGAIAQEWTQRPYLTSKTHASLSRVTAVAAVPARPAKEVSIPHRISAVIARELEVEEVSNLVWKTHPTPEAKLGSAFDPSVYEVEGDLTGHTVLLVDDVFRSGNTMKSVATQLRSANAHVIGFCLAKAVRGMKAD